MNIKMQDSTIYMGLFRLFNVLDNFQLCEKILFPMNLVANRPVDPCKVA